LQAYALMKYDALNLGHREAELSAAQLHGLRTNAPVPILSANLMDRATGQPIFDGWRLVERDGYKIAIIGVLDPRGLAEKLGDGLSIERMETVLSRLLPQIRSQADLVVLLAFTDEPTLD